MVLRVDAPKERRMKWQSVLKASLPPHPLLVYAVAITIRLTDASCGPAAYLVNHVGRTLHGPQAVSERVSEGVDNTSLWHPWPEPFVDSG